MQAIRRFVERALVLVLSAAILSSSALPADEQTARVRAYTARSNSILLAGR